MKVALISYGFAEYCIQQANGLARMCDVMLMLPACDAAEYESLLDPAVDFRPFQRPRLRHPLRQLALATNLAREIRRYRPDVIHYQQGHLWFNLALPFLRSFPLVLTIHDPRYHVGDAASHKTPQGMLDFGFRRADRVIVHGEALKSQLVESVHMSGEMTHVIPHVAMGSSTAPAAHSDDGRTVLFFGRIWEYKGLRYLIEAQPRISDVVPDAHFIIAGTGESLEPYRRMMVSPKRFTLHNRYISPAERDGLFRQASLVVLPYLEATQSGVVPVAYSYGKPVVATRTGALAEAVDHNRTGLLVPPRDAAALADAIIALLRDSARRHAMGSAARQKIDTELSPQSVARQLIDVYHLAMRDRAAKYAMSPRKRVAL